MTVMQPGRSRQAGIHLLPAALLLSLAMGCTAMAAEPYKPTWESLKTHPVPTWFEDAKFGIYTHWGIYSVPAYLTEWYPHGMYMKEGFRKKDFYGYHTKHFGPPEKFGYKDFIPQFTGAKFNADAWADLFARAGAKFAGPVAEHHDGFAMWDSKLTTWDAADMGPKVDVTGKLAVAIRKKGMRFIASFHHARNWSYYPHEGDFDTNDPKYAYVGSIYGPIHGPKDPPSKEFLEDWKARIVEVVEKYDPQMLWFDGGWGRSHFDPYKRQLLCDYYNRARKAGKEVCVTYKGEDLPEGAGILDYERGRASGIRKTAWLTDTSVYVNSWGYIQDLKYYSADWMIDELLDIVSKNGVMLLNVGPKPDGTIPEKAREMLLAMGAWLKANGEGVYGTRPWKVFGEGPTKVPAGKRARRKDDYTAKDIRFTTKGKTLYAICLAWPGEKAAVQSLGRTAALLEGRIARVTMLGAEGDLPFTRGDAALTVTVPKTPPCKHAFVLKIVTE